MTSSTSGSGDLVVVLTAGRGTRARVYGPWLHKALLPLGDRPVLSRLLGHFPATARFVFAVGHLGDQVQAFVEMAHPDLDATFVSVDPYAGPGTGPATSLLACRDHLDGPFTVTACDAVYEAPLPSPRGNWIGVAAVDDPENWCTVRLDGDRVTGLAYRDPHGTNLAYTGTAHVQDSEPFLTELEKADQLGEVVLDPGFLRLCDHGLVVRKLAWRDAGNEETYAAVRAAYGGEASVATKTSDLTYLFDDRVVKLTDDAATAARLFERGRTLTGLTPEVLGHAGGVLCTVRVGGASDLDAADPSEVRSCLEWVESDLWQRRVPVHAPASVERAMRAMYVDKTRDRVAHLLDRLPGLDDERRVNAIDCAPITELLELVASDHADVLSGAVIAPVHGDLHGENVLVDADRGRWLIDWRTDFGGLTEVGDLTYDLAKMLHTLEFSTPTMVEKRFNVERVADDALRITHEDIVELAGSRDAFWEFVAARGHDEHRIAIVDALVFLSMCPLYDDEIGRYLFLLGKALLAAALDLSVPGRMAFDRLFGGKRYPRRPEVLSGGLAAPQSSAERP